MGEIEYGQFAKKDRRSPGWIASKDRPLITDKEVEQLNINLYLWVPIHKGYCTLHELQTVYDIDDLMDMHESIAVFNEVERRASKQDK